VRGTAAVSLAAQRTKTIGRLNLQGRMGQVNMIRTPGAPTMAATKQASPLQQEHADFVLFLTVDFNGRYTVWGH